jgi:hypothetical protein
MDGSTPDINTIVSYLNLVEGMWGVIIPLIASVAGLTVAVRVLKRVTRA